MASGWAFWCDDGRSTVVIYVGTSDFYAAKKKAVNEAPEAAISSFRELPDRAVKLLQIDGGGVSRGGVVELPASGNLPTCRSSKV